MHLPSSVLARLQRYFATSQQKETKALLASYCEGLHQNEHERVLLDILEWAKGNTREVGGSGFQSKEGLPRHHYVGRVSVAIQA